MLSPVEVNSKYHHLSVVRIPESATYIFDSATERTYRFDKIIEEDHVYYAKVTTDLYLPIAKRIKAADRWYFVD